MGICLNWGFHYCLSWPCLPGEAPQSLSLGRREVMWSIHVSEYEELSGMGRQVPRSHSSLQTHPGSAGGAISMPGNSWCWGCPHPAWHRGWAGGLYQRVRLFTQGSGGQVRHKRVVGACLSPPRPVPPCTQMTWRFVSASSQPPLAQLLHWAGHWK